MLASISCSHLFVLDQDAALEFYVGVLGLQVHTDADLGVMRWLTVSVPATRAARSCWRSPVHRQWTTPPPSRHASC